MRKGILRFQYAYVRKFKRTLPDIEPFTNKHGLFAMYSALKSANSSEEFQKLCKSIPKKKYHRRRIYKTPAKPTYKGVVNYGKIQAQFLTLDQRLGDAKNK